MIKVLKSYTEIEKANDFLDRYALPKNGHTPEKNWDLYQLYAIAEKMPREIKIIDLGCGSLFALKLLRALGFRNLYGIDLSMPLRNKLTQAYWMWRSRSLYVPFHLYRGDLTATRFPAQMFDSAVCLSVLEHGVDMEKLFAEMRRLLRPGGSLFITIDYWEDKINIQQDSKPFSLAWKIFCKRDVEDIIGLAHKSGFSLSDNSIIPACSDKCVIWNNQEYTFLAMVFTRNR